jgi:hypothetical protein
MLQEWCGFLPGLTAVQTGDAWAWVVEIPIRSTPKRMKSQAASFALDFAPHRPQG